MMNNQIEQLKQITKTGQDNYETNFKQLLSQGGSFVVRTKQMGIGKITISKKACDELGLKHHTIHSSSVLSVKDISTAIDNAIQEGVDIVFVDEPERLEPDEVEQVISAFEQSDIRVVVMFHKVTGDYAIVSIASRRLSEWIEQTQPRVLDYQIDLPNFNF